MSASNAQGLNQLLAVIDQRLAGQEHIISLTFRPQDGAARAFAYEKGQILESQFDEAGCEFVRVSLKPADLARLEAQAGWPETRLDQPIICGLFLNPAMVISPEWQTACQEDERHEFDGKTGRTALYHHR